MPDKLEAGTYAYESVAGMDAAIRYLQDLGVGVELDGLPRPGPRAEVLRAAMRRTADYERSLVSEWMDEVGRIDSVTVHGVTDASRFDARVPTLSFTVEGVVADVIAAGLAGRNVGVRSGHMYSPRLLGRLGLLPEGVVRASLVHYNTREEILRFHDTLVDVIADARANPR